MDLDELLIRVHPGEGLVARGPGSVLVVLPPLPDQAAFADRLWNVVEDSARNAGSGRLLARQVARLVAGAEPGDVPSFGLVAQADEGLVLMLHGDTDADVTSAEGQERLSGNQVATWVDRILELPIELLAVRPSGKAYETPDPRLRLGEGVVNGSGFSVLPAGPTGLPEAIPGRAVDEAAVPPAALVDAAGVGAKVPTPSVGGSDVGDETKVGLPQTTWDSPPDPTRSGAFGALVPADVTLDEPDQALPEVERPPAGVAVEGPPPPIGRIVFDDASWVDIDGSYVLGREPETDADVVSGCARPLIVDDPDRSVSRVHLAITLEGPNIVLTDRGAANGTYIAVPGQAGWVPLRAHQPTTIEWGTRVRIGDRQFQVDSAPAPS